MGNTGRRSNGCQICKNRRIKCDERKPTCLNCRKAKRVCYGYRDNFRDETQSTTSHVVENRKRLKGRYQPIVGRIYAPFSIDPDDAVLNQRFGVLAEQFKEGPEELPALIPSMYASARSASPCTPAILAIAWVTSASFATVGQRMGAARRKYGEAMVKLQDALQDPSTAMADDALFTVLLMLMIENTTATSNSLPNPTKHIKGAVTLINYRGKQNFASETGRKLFSFVKNTFTALPAWDKIEKLSFSDEVIEADRKLCTLCEPSSISTRLENIAFAISVLRGKLNREDPDRSNAQSIDKILQESRALDQELMAWRIAVPREWETLSYSAPNDQNQPLEDARSAPASTWNGYSASYPDMAIAKLMNHFRMHSIAIQRIDIRCWRLVAQCRHAERSILELTAAEHVTVAHDSPTHLKAYSAIKTMVDGICASVPFHLETPALKGRKEPGGRKKSSEPSKQLPAGQVGAEAPSSEGPVLRPPKRPAGGCMLQPLVVAYSAPGIPADQKIWILGKALEIGKRVGMDEEMIEKTFDSLAAT